MLPVDVIVRAPHIGLMLPRPAPRARTQSEFPLKWGRQAATSRHRLRLQPALVACSWQPEVPTYAYAVWHRVGLDAIDALGANGQDGQFSLF